MGRCNGGGGRRHGGGGWQEGQNKGVKSGKTGHGRSGGHDAQVKAKREPQRFDKLGRPLNHGPWRNGYRIEGGNAGPDVERVGVGDAVAARLRSATALLIFDGRSLFPLGSVTAAGVSADNSSSVARVGRTVSGESAWLAPAAGVEVRSFVFWLRVS